jgi:hypothetical protein
LDKAGWTERFCGVAASLIRQHKCLCCKDLFTPAPARIAVQKFCSKPACRKASKAHSQREWCRNNPGYFTGPEHVERVQRWREDHPGYGRGKGKSRGKDALQEIAPGQVAGNEVVVDNDPPKSCSGADALQDIASAQTVLIIGLMAELMGDALQDNLPGLTRALIEKGRRVLDREYVREAGNAA